MVHEEKDANICKICERVFTNYSSLYYHMKCTHENAKLFKCKFCDKPFNLKSGLKLHMKVHENNQELFKCNLCGKSCKLERSLKYHIKHIHEGDEVHECKLCKKKFGMKQHLQKHVKRVHQKRKNREGKFAHVKSVQRKDFKSDKCDKSHSLKIHIKPAQGIKEADEINNSCNKTHTQRNALKSHIKSVHEGKTEIVEKRKNAENSKIDQNYEVSTNSHINSVHVEEIENVEKTMEIENSKVGQNYASPISKIFENASNEVARLEDVHKIEPLNGFVTCDICDISFFGTSETLEMHMNDVHYKQKITRGKKIEIAYEGPNTPCWNRSVGRKK